MGGPRSSAGESPALLGAGYRGTRSTCSISLRVCRLWFASSGGEPVAEPLADEREDLHQALGRLDGAQCPLMRGE
jgi:hypothetical protein